MSLKNLTRSLGLLSGLVFCLLTAMAAEPDLGKLPPAADKKGVTYEKDIKSILDKSCIKCHGAEKQKAKLRLDSLAAVMKGGEDGKVIESGNSAKSVIVQAVARLDPDSAMPPKGGGPPLTKEQVGLIRAWIDQGAK